MVGIREMNGAGHTLCLFLVKERQSLYKQLRYEIDGITVSCTERNKNQ